jgi:transcriptional regulator GlxA family with amidase domain
VRQNGMTPHQWLMHQRVLAAQRRLEKTAESIDQVAAAVGLESAESWESSPALTPIFIVRRSSQRKTRSFSPTLQILLAIRFLTTR